LTQAPAGTGAILGTRNEIRIICFNTAYELANPDLKEFAEELQPGEKLDTVYFGCQENSFYAKTTRGNIRWNHLPRGLENALQEVYTAPTWKRKREISGLAIGELGGWVLWGEGWYKYGGAVPMELIKVLDTDDGKNGEKVGHKIKVRYLKASAQPLCWHKQTINLNLTQWHEFVLITNDGHFVSKLHVSFEQRFKEVAAQWVGGIDRVTWTYFPIYSYEHPGTTVMIQPFPESEVERLTRDFKVIYGAVNGRMKGKESLSSISRLLRNTNTLVVAQAMSYFARWEVPEEILGSILNIDSLKRRGGDILTAEFVVVIYLLMCYHTNRQVAITPSLPTELYRIANGQVTRQQFEERRGTIMSNVSLMRSTTASGSTRDRDATSMASDGSHGDLHMDRLGSQRSSGNTHSDMPGSPRTNYTGATSPMEESLPYSPFSSGNYAPSASSGLPFSHAKSAPRSARTNSSGTIPNHIQPQLGAAELDGGPMGYISNMHAAELHGNGEYTGGDYGLSSRSETSASANGTVKEAKKSKLGGLFKRNTERRQQVDDQWGGERI
jgi:hypothetical protein